MQKTDPLGGMRWILCPDMIVQEEEGHASGSATFVVPLRVEAQIVCEPICWGLEAKAFLFALQCQEQISYDCISICPKP